MIWSETTVCRLAADSFLLCGPTLAVDRDFDWLCQHAGDDDVSIRKGFDLDAALMVMGPRSRNC